jgi:hypothetical protein
LGEWKLELSFAPNNNFPDPNQYTINGASLNPSTLNQKGSLSNSGALAFSTYDSSLITPAGSGWNLTICPLASAKCGVFNFSTSGATNNISSSLTASIPSPRFNATAGAYGYADIEASLSLIPGGTYWNTATLKQRIWNGSSWADSGGSGSGTVNAGTAGQTAYYAANGTTVSGNPNVVSDGINGLSVTNQVAAGTGLSSPIGSAGAYRAFGDSLTACAHITSTSLSNCYVNRWGQDLGLGTNFILNRGFGGDLAADVPFRVLLADNPAVTGTPNLYSLLIGVNDANTNGVGTGELNFKLFHTANLSWFAIPATYKVAGSTATPAGTCANDTTFLFVTGEQCTANASTLTLSATTYGGTTYIWYRVISSDAGTWTYAVDGGSPVSVSTAPPVNFSTSNGHATSMGVVRVTGLSAASHNFVFTQTNSGTMSILAVGTVPNLAYTSLPVVSAADVPKQLDGNKLAATQAYAADALEDIKLLQGDNLNIHFAPVNSVLQATTAAADMFDVLHPNDIGDAELYRAFKSSAQQVQRYANPLIYDPFNSGTLTSVIGNFHFETSSVGQIANFGSTGSSGLLSIDGSAATSDVLRFYQGGTANPKWDIGQKGSLKGANFLVYDFSTNQYVVDLSQGMPQDSITGNAAGPVLLVVQTPAARKGTFICTAGGTITITNANEATTSDVVISLKTVGGTISTAPAMNGITAGTGFTVLCGAADTSTYNYNILN